MSKIKSFLFLSVLVFSTIGSAQWTKKDKPSSDPNDYGTHGGGGSDEETASKNPEAVTIAPGDGSKLDTKLLPCAWGGCDKNSMDSILLGDKGCEDVANMSTQFCMAERASRANKDEKEAQ